MTRSDFPVYQKAVAAYLANDPKGFRSLRRDPTLTADERLLLEARSLFWSRRWAESRKRLSRVSAERGTFLHAERSFLQATSFFQEGDFESSASLNLTAREGYLALSDRRGLFLSANNLRVDFSRMGHQKLSEYWLEIARQYAIEDREKHLLDRAQACLLSRRRQYALAGQCLDRIFSGIDSMEPHDRETTYSVASDIYFRANRPLDALRILTEQRRHAGRDLGRLEFERAMIEMNHSRLPLPPPSAPVRKCPEYLLKWELIRSLQAGERERSRQLWTELREQSPGMFGDPFCCLDDSERDSAFWAAIRKLTELAARAPVEQVPRHAGKLGLLEQALLQSGSPLRKEDLIERIWGVRYDPVWDVRFYKLVERAKKHAIPILNVRRAYSIAEAPARS